MTLSDKLTGSSSPKEGILENEPRSLFGGSAAGTPSREPSGRESCPVGFNSTYQKLFLNLALKAGVGAAIGASLFCRAPSGRRYAMCIGGGIGAGVSFKEMDIYLRNPDNESPPNALDQANTLQKRTCHWLRARREHLADKAEDAQRRAETAIDEEKERRRRSE